MGRHALPPPDPPDPPPPGPVRVPGAAAADGPDQPVTVAATASPADATADRTPRVDPRLALVAVPLLIAGIIVAIVQVTGRGPADGPGPAAAGAEPAGEGGEGPAGDCSVTGPLIVSAPPEDEGLVRALADAWADSGQPGSCAAVEVVTRAGTSTDTSAGEGEATAAAPAVVVRRSPDVDGAPVVGAVGDPTVVASTVAVVATDPATATRLGWPAADLSPSTVNSALLSDDAGSRTGIGVADPTSSVAALLAMTALATSPLGVPLADVPGTGSSEPAVQGGLFAIFNAVTLEAPTQPELMAAATESPVRGLLVDEAAVARHNAGAPAEFLAPLYPSGAATLVEVTAVAVDRPGGAGDDERGDADALLEAAGSLVAFAGTDNGRRAVATLGYREADGSLAERVVEHLGAAADGAPVAGQDDPSPPPAPQLLATMTFGWNGVSNPGRYILVMDVSGSMAREVPGTGRTKLQFAQQAAIEAIQQAPRSGEIGLWEFSTALDGDLDYRELVPNGPITDIVDNRTRRDALISAVEGLTTRGDTGLYDTALASFRRAQEQYQAGEPNLVVLVTDGMNEDTTGGIGREELLETLAAEQDPARPIQITTIAYGADADVDALARIAEVTGGLAYVSPNPAQIGQVLTAAFSGGRAGLLPGDVTGPPTPGT